MNYRILKIDEPVCYDFISSYINIVDNLIMVYDNETKTNLLGVFACKDFYVVSHDNL